MTAETQSIDSASDRAGLFAQQGFVVVRQLIEEPLRDFLQSYVHTKFASRLIFAKDQTVPNAPSGYGDLAFDGLLEHVRPRIEHATGFDLFPTYSYFRLYRHGDVLKRHRDRPACEISVTLNIAQAPAEPWPIHVEGSAGPYAALLSPGDALIYRGCDLFHWREPYQGNQLAQVFLHYVDRHGQNSDHKFDKRPSLMRPKKKDDEPVGR